MQEPSARDQGPSGAGPVRRLLVAAALVLSVAAVYWNSLAAPFQFDDEPAIVYNPTIRSLASLRTVLSPPASGAGVTGRPLVNLSLAVNHAMGGLDPHGYHAVNLALHALAVLTLWGVLRRTLRQCSGQALCPRVEGPSPDGPRTSGSWALQKQEVETCAFLVALLWAVHPLLTESVVCVVQRNEIMGGLFCLLTLYGFIRAADGGGRLWLAISVFACLLGVTSKEIVATAPLLVLLYDRTFVAGGFAAAWRQRRGYYLLLAATWLPLAWLMVSGNQRAGAVGFGLGMSSWDYLLTQCKALTIYLKLSVWPHPLVVDYGMDISPLGEVWWRGLVVLGLLGATVWALVRKPVWGFVGAWFFVILAPSSSFVPLTTQTIAEHRMYLPLVAVIVLGMAALRWLAGGRTLPVALCLAAVLGVVTVRRNQVYQSVFNLWSDTVIKAPGNARAHLNFGQVLFKAGQLPEAATQFEEALQLRPGYAEAHYNQGLAMTRLGRPQEAIAQYEEALRLLPDYPVAHNDLGIAYAEAGRPAEARQQFEAAIRSREDFPGAHFNLANLLLRSGSAAEAISHLEKAVRQNPRERDYHVNLAFALMQERRSAEAISHYEAAIRLDPATPELRLNLALALAAAGRLREAIPQVEEALRLRPDFEPARRYLTEMRADLQRMEPAKR